MLDLVEIGANLSSFLASLSPQIKEGSLQWYFSGSLATITMASAESITEIELDEGNNVIGEKRPKDITAEQRNRIKTFSRKLGNDVDVVNVNGGLFSGAPMGNKPHILNIKENVPNVLDLMSWSSTLGGTMYIDSLESERVITHHPVAKVKIQNGLVYITAPPEQLAHKLHEAINLREMLNGKFSTNADVISKYEKDIRDLSSMFYGFQGLYDKEEFYARVYTALIQKDGSKFNMKNINLEEIMKTIINDASSYLKTIADDKSDEEIETFLSSLLYMRTAIVKDKEASKTPLQQRKEVLSFLEKEKRTIANEEELMKYPKQGQDIGD